MIRSKTPSRLPAQPGFERATSMAFLWALLALVLHVLPGVVGPVHAQGTRKDDVVFNSRGVPLAGATVRVCAQPATGQPCTPLALIYSDPALTQALANPTTSDGLGNYHFYAAPGKYMVEISGPGITTKQTPDVIIPIDPTSPTFSGNVSAFSLTLSGNLTVSGSTTVLGNLASGTLNLSNQSTPPGAAGAGTVNLYTKTADKRVYYKDETGTEIGPLGPGNGAQTNVQNTFTAQQNIDADFHNKGPNPWFDISRYGAYSNFTPPTITCATTSGSNQMTCSGGTSDFAVGHGVSIQLAGPAATLTAPGAPVALTLLTISSNVGTLTEVPFTSYAPGSSVTIAGATDGTLNGTFTVTAGSTGQINITHANCNPCNVGGSATIVAVVPGTVTSAGILNGTTNYSYKIVSRDKNGGLSPASAPFTITTGASTLGVFNGPTLSGCNRASGIVTCTTAAAHNFQAGVPVNIPRGTGDQFFEGQFTIVATPTSTTFTFYQAGQADHTGTITPGAVSPQVVAKNVVKWVMQPYGQMQAYIYRCTGASCSSYTLVGISQGMDSSFEDWGFGLSAAVPSYISTTTPTAVAVRAPLNTTITAINGNTVTLAANSTATVGSTTVLHDNGPNLRLACTGASGTVYIPNGGAYNFNSILDLAPCTFSKILIGSQVTLNDPWLIKSNLTIEGLPTACAPSSTLDYCAGVGGFAFPLFLFTPGSAGTNALKYLDMNCLQNYQSCLFYDQDNNGNNVSAQSYWQMDFAGGNSMPLKFGGAFGYFWDYGVLFNNTIVGNWGIPPTLAVQANQGIGNINQQLMGDFQVRNLTTGDGEWVWDDKGQGNLSTAFVGNNKFSYLVNESSHYPQIRLNLLASSDIVANFEIHTHQYADPLGGQAVPIYDLTNVGAGRLASFTVNGQGCASGAQPVFEMAPGQGGVFLGGNGISCSLSGADTVIVRGANQDLYQNSSIAVSGSGQVAYTMAMPATPSVSNAAGTLAAGTYFYRIIPNDVNNQQGPVSQVTASCTSNGSQACVISFTPVAGQVSTTLCRGITANNLACSSIGTAFQFSGSSFTDNLATGNFSASVPGLANGSATVLGSFGLSATTYKFVGGGAASTVSGAFTGNRTQSLPDVSGVIPVTGYINAAYDNFNRANGAIGANFTVTNGGINVASNAIQGTAAGNNVAFWIPNSFFSDQFAEAMVASLNGTTDFIGPSVRVSPGSNWYSCFENSTTVFIQKEVTGGFTNITSAASTGAIGDILRLEAQGSTLTCYKNGAVILTITDTSLLSGSPGMQLSGNVATLDNWTGGNLHPLSQLDIEADYTKVQHLNAGVGLGAETFTASPRAEQNVFLPGALTSTWTGATWTTDKAVTVTRVQVQAKTAPAGCTTNSVVRFTDGTSPVNVTIAAAANDSGPIIQNYAAGSALQVLVQTAAAGCTTSPADANVVVQYRMQ
ncbi:MAG TPA: hypothetical protein VOA78_11215 [Candidatus Dormibacteraeota bacterium]|nr:hypothetical protein [Candidatus Dormibacteraeota bacterium]